MAPGLQAGPGHPSLPRRLPGSGAEQLPAAADHPDDSSSNRKRIGRRPSSADEKKDAARAPTATGRAPRRPGLRPKSWMPEQEEEPPTDRSIDRTPAPSPYQTGEGGRARQGFFELGAWLPGDKTRWLLRSALQLPSGLRRSARPRYCFFKWRRGSGKQEERRAPSRDGGGPARAGSGHVGPRRSPIRRWGSRGGGGKTRGVVIGRRRGGEAWEARAVGSERGGSRCVRWRRQSSARSRSGGGGGGRVVSAESRDASPVVICSGAAWRARAAAEAAAAHGSKSAPRWLSSNSAGRDKGICELQATPNRSRGGGRARRCALRSLPWIRNEWLPRRWPQDPGLGGPESPRLASEGGGGRARLRRSGRVCWEASLGATLSDSTRHLRWLWPSSQLCGDGAGGGGRNPSVSTKDLPVGNRWGRKHPLAPPLEHLCEEPSVFSGDEASRGNDVGEPSALWQK